MSYSVSGSSALLFHRQRRPAPEIGARNSVMITVRMAFTLALLFPIRVVEEADPDWRLLIWLLAFGSSER